MDFYVLYLRDTKAWKSIESNPDKLPSPAQIKQFFSDQNITLDKYQEPRVYTNGTVGVYTNDDPTGVWPLFDMDLIPRNLTEELLDEITSLHKRLSSGHGTDENWDALLLNLAKLVLGLFNRQL